MARQRRRRAKLPGEPVELEIESLNHEGRGIAHRNGKVQFVDGALSGETVRAQLVNSRSQFDELKTVAVLSASAQRVTPPCSVAGICGGCSLQHMDGATQLALKQSVLLEKLEQETSLAASDFNVLPALASKDLHYRRKARLAVRMVSAKGGALVGFREKYSSFITEMDACPVLDQRASQLIPALRALISSLHCSRDIPQVELALGESQQEGGSDQLALIFRHMKPLLSADRDLLLAFAIEHALDLYLQPSGPDSIHKLYPESGPERLQYFLPDQDLRLQFHPADFTQVNAEVNRAIVGQALQQLDLQATDRVLDLFCGIGNFTLAMARNAEFVLGVEGSADLVARARSNAELNNLGNTEFHTANLCQPMQTAAWSQQSFNKVLLDPPRSGALEVVPQLARLGAEKIVYISCNPATLARDAAFLLKEGYHLNSAGVMDMFPHTTHVESMAVFSRNQDVQ